MANQLGMDKVQAIFALHEVGWSNRRIARELGIHRTTVAGYLEGQGDSKPTKVPTGSDVPTEGSEGQSDEANERGRSRCTPYRELILEKLGQGLSAQRIFQDLRDEHGFAHGYDCVKRYVRKLRGGRTLPFRRMECSPGEEAQVDFGTGAPLKGPDGKRKKTYVFRIVLSHSRKAYSEAVDRQTTENFIRCLENAFSHFRGVPQTLVIDNLRAAVSKADWYDPEINPKMQSFCLHYGTVVLPTKPYTPRHKGKVERGIDYVQENALKGRTFSDLTEQNEFLLRWETSVADTRIHGTTRKQVGKLFEESERASLQPVPLERFPLFHEAQRKVHRDGHVSVQNAYYSVPPEYVTRRVWVRWDSRLVRVFDHKMQQIALHTRRAAGQFSTQSKHIASEKTNRVERGAVWMLSRAALIGTHSKAWAESMIEARGIEGVRVLQGLLSLANKHPHAEIERACEIASGYGAYRLRTIRRLIKRKAPKQEQFDFLDEHPIIRSLGDYGELVRHSFAKE
jgi:transposase